MQVGTDQALPRGNGRRKQTEPQHAQDYLAHQTTQGGGCCLGSVMPDCPVAASCSGEEVPE